MYPTFFLSQFYFHDKIIVKKNINDKSHRFLRDNTDKLIIKAEKVQIDK